MDEFLIRNTTREQREKIVRDALDCGGDECENCAGCGSADPFEMYRPYIDGEKEIADITREFNTGYIKG